MRDKTFWSETLLAMSFALSLYLMLATIVLYVRATYMKGQIINRLSLKPFTFVLLFCVCQMAQMVYIQVFPNARHEVLLTYRYLQLTKTAFILSAVYYQLLEWFAQTHMVLFQKSVPNELLEIKRRVFQQREKIHNKIAAAIFLLMLLSAFVSTTVIFVVSEDKNADFKTFQIFKQLQLSYYTFALVVSLVIVVTMWVSLKRFQYLYYLDHRCKLLTQSLGLIFMLLIDIISVALELEVSHYREFKDSDLVPEEFLMALESLQLIGFGVFVAAKTTEDCFYCFSRGDKQIHYSIHQYREQVQLMLRRQSLMNLLAESSNNLTRSENKKAKLLGIDLDFMVEHLAGDKEFIQSNGGQIYQPPEEEESRQLSKILFAETECVDSLLHPNAQASRNASLDYRYEDDGEETPFAHMTTWKRPDAFADQAFAANLGAKTTIQDLDDFLLDN